MITPRATCGDVVEDAPAAPFPDGEAADAEEVIAMSDTGSASAAAAAIQAFGRPEPLRVITAPWSS
jgi:hypothetical protein